MSDAVERQRDDEVQRCVEALGEHCDSVLILATVVEDGRSRLVVGRAGNFYASKGAATAWVEDENNKDLAEKMKED